MPKISPPRHLFRRARTARNRFRPIVEAIEDRLLLSTVANVYTVINLNDSGTGSGSSGDLRYCITQADANGGGTIDFESGLSSPIQLTNALPDLSQNITINGPGASILTVKGGGPSSNFSIFKVGSGVTATISGLTLSGGHGNNILGSSVNGGGINNGGTLTVTDSTLSGDSATGGGGIFNTGTLTVTDSTLSGDSAPNGDGGGISNTGTLTVTDSTLSGDSANGAGGGIFNSGTLTMTGSTLSGDSGVGSYGGGLYNDGEDGNATATVSDSTFSSNSATYGGGIGNVSATLTLTNSTLSGNSATTGGGGIDTAGSRASLTLTNDTITANRGTSLGGGIENNGSAPPATLNNTIVAGNFQGTGNTASDVYGTVASASSHNLIGTGGSGGLRLEGNIVGVVNPDLGTLGNYGGTTLIIPLLPGSPAIDAGSNALAVDANGTTLSTDQRGVNRIVNGTVDVGAFESRGFMFTTVGGSTPQSTGINSAFASPLIVKVSSPSGDPVAGGTVSFAAPVSGASATFATSTATIGSNGQAAVTATANNVTGSYTVTASASGVTSPATFNLTNTPAGSLVVNTTNDQSSSTDGSNSLRQAIAYADTLSGTPTITFASNVTGTIQLGGGLTLDHNVAITGPGASALTIEGGGPSSNFSDFTVNSGITATISRLTIAGGHARGGGINNAGTLTLTGSTLSGNTALVGGGLYNSGSVTLTGSTLSDNSASTNGGGIFNATGGTVTLTNSTLSGNSANLGDGGGIENFSGTVTVNGSTFSGDSAEFGGGIFHASGTVTVTDSTLWNNSASNGGGGIYNSATLTLTNDTLTANRAGASGGGGLYNYNPSTSTLDNTIVAGNFQGAGNSASDIRGTVDTANSFNNLIGTGGSGGLVNGVNGNLVGIANPGLGTLGIYSGTTQTVPLLPGSPAIDAGDDSLAVDANGKALTTDQRGVIRNVNVNGTFDIGAFESRSFTITTVNGSTPQSTGINSAFGSPLAVLVLSPSFDPVAGGTVSFTVNPAAGGAAATLSALTATIGSSNQQAAVTATANNAPGSFTVTASASGAASPATFTLTVTAGTPTANPQTVAVGFDTAKAFMLTGSDPDSPPLTLTYTVAANPSHGTLSGTAPNLTYTPSAGYHGTDTFTFTTNNGTNTSAPATVTLNVAAGTPTANPQTVAVSHDSSGASFTLTGSDPSSPPQPLTYTVATNPTHGTLSGFNAATGAVTYTPSAGYHGTDTFTFTASNGTNTSSAATVTLDVAAGTPTANPQAVNTNENAPVNVTLTGSDPDVPALSLIYAISTAPTHGMLSGTAPNLTYTPSAGYHGTDTFTFTVNNGHETSGTATVTLNVAAGTPTANPQTVNVGFDTAKAFTLTGSDPDSPPLALTYTVATNPTHGTLSGTAPNLTYTPSAGYHGTDTFTFTTNNGHETSNTATVTLDVAAGTPTANPQSVNTSENAPVNVTLTGSDPDVPPLPLTYVISTGPTHGTLSGTAPNLTYTPDAGYFGPDTFQFTVSNGTNTGAPATVSIDVAQSIATVSGTVGVSWGTAGSATLQTNADGVRLLPAGRNTDLPWLGIDKLTITLSQAATLTAADVSVTGLTVANYGPVTISGSGTTYTITLFRAINAADRVTLTIGNAGIATFTRRLDVLPGDFNDDGGVSMQDALGIRNEYLGFSSAVPTIFGDVNGDNVVDVNDYNAARRLIGTTLPGIGLS